MWGGWNIPLTVEKLKDWQIQSIWFLQVLSKSYWTAFTTIFETLSALEVSHVTISGGTVYKRSMIFEVFGAYLSELLIFLHEIFFVAISCRVLVINIKSLIVGALVTLETRIKVPILAFFDNFGIFRAVCFGPSLWSWTLIFLWKISSMYILSRAVWDFFMITSPYQVSV